MKVEGFVERVFVDFVGKPVRKGQALFSLYSPSLLSVQNEYVLALQTRDTLSKGGDVIVANGDQLVASARRKLELWDVSEKQLAELERTRQSSKTLTVVSPIAGVVTAKNIVEGARLAPGDEPYEITDLSEVWVMVDVYETELSRVRVGLPGTLTLQSFPDRQFKGRVEFIEPTLNAETRTVKIHLHFKNRDELLKPGMFGEVMLEGATHEGLQMPIDAVIHSGESDVVFLSLGDGKFQPREVRLGAKDADNVEIVSGLEEGQQVVTRANFLIDSESQLRASLAALGAK